MTDLPENFAEHPVSLAERRADKSQSGADWTPRDALIAVLREIDQGKIKPDALIILIRDCPDEETAISRYVSACPDMFTALGLMARVKHRYLRNHDADADYA